MAFDEALVRTALPEFEIERAVGDGGQGTVFLGRWNGAPVVLKLFEPDDPRRVDREVKFLSSHTCPNLVQAHGRRDIELGGLQIPVVIYEYLPGGDLGPLMTPAAPRVEANVLREIGISVATAIEALWRARIVHRDIKPKNIVRAADGRFVLVDLGFALHLERSGITTIGIGLGTRGFMSPEQLRGRRDLTLRSDIFSLGVTLYALASRRLPYATPSDLFSPRPAASLSAIRADLPRSLCQAIECCLQKPVVRRPIDVVSLFLNT